MNSTLKHTLIAMATAALGLSAGCGGSEEPAADEASAGGETAGEASCGATEGEASCGAEAEGGEASCGAEAEGGEGGEASCGEGSCG